MMRVIKILIFTNVILLLTGCGSKYVYKPISYMSPTKTYLEAESYCENVVRNQLSQKSAENRRVSEENIARMRNERIAYARANPTYSTTVNCNRFGNNVHCAGSSTPNSYNSYGGYNTVELASRSGSNMGNALGQLLARPGMMKDCMASEGYEKVKVEKEEVSSHKPQALITKDKIYKEVDCIKSSPWGGHYQCNDGSSQFNGEGEVKSGQFYPASLVLVDSVKKQAKVKKRSDLSRNEKITYVISKGDYIITNTGHKYTYSRIINNDLKLDNGDTLYSKEGVFKVNFDNMTKEQLEQSLNTPVIVKDLSSNIEDLKKVKDLFDSGIIDKNEFNAMKQKVIDRL